MTAPIDWRDLPAVEPIEPPSRYSVTLLRHADRCPRAAYLYRKYRGGAPAPQLDRGTAWHLHAERVPWELMTAGETVMNTDVAEASMNAVLDEHPELHVTAEDADALRAMAYHVAGDARGRAGERKPDGRAFPIGYDWQLESLLGVERLFALEVEGVRVVGKIDLAWIFPDLVRIRDWKTSIQIPKAEEFTGTWQTKCYGALALFGNPVNEQTGELEPRIGGGINWVDVGEDYPRFVRQGDSPEGPAGSVVGRSQILSRTDLRKFVDVDLARRVRQLKEAFETWEFGASNSSHCEICPAVSECPLPKALRPHAGEINDFDQAVEALTLAERMADKVSAIRAEVRIFAKAHGHAAIPCGSDLEYQFVPAESWKADWDAIAAGVERARQLGEPFELDRHRRRSVSTTFKKVRVKVAAS